MWEINFLIARMSVGSVMTKTLITVDPERGAVDAARIILDHKVSALPVVERGTVVGTVTETDMLRGFAAMAISVMPTLAGH